MDLGSQFPTEVERVLMPRLRHCPPVGGWMCAASPDSSGFACHPVSAPRSDVAIALPALTSPWPRVTAVRVGCRSARYQPAAAPGRPHQRPAGPRPAASGQRSTINDQRILRWAVAGPDHHARRTRQRPSTSPARPVPTGAAVVVTGSGQTLAVNIEPVTTSGDQRSGRVAATAAPRASGTPPGLVRGGRPERRLHVRRERRRRPRPPLVREGRAADLRRRRGPTSANVCRVASSALGANRKISAPQGCPMQNLHEDIAIVGDLPSR
jgi:hypothetical protein